MAPVKASFAYSAVLLVFVSIQNPEAAAHRVPRSVFSDIIGGSQAGGGGPQRGPEVQDVNCGQYAIQGNDTYRIQSPLSNYGFPIFSFYQCQWKFYGTSSCTPAINCTSFSLPVSANCTSSGLEVTDQLTKTQTFCGNTGPVNASTGTDSLVVTYTSNLAAPSRGFSCLVTCPAPDAQVNAVANPLPGPTRTNCTCGVPGSNSTTPQRIVGGKDAPPLYWKWQIIMVPKGARNPFCGGSLINDRYVLTAAHCVVNTGLVGFPAVADVVLNEYNLKNQTETITIRRSIAAAIPHPFYNPVRQDYDYAILQLASPVDLTATSEPKVTPVCLPPLNERNLYAGDIATATGFGTLTEGGQAATILQEADIPVITNEDCNEPQKYNGTITSRMLCAGFPQGGVDACQGDSGGPFVYNNGGRYINIGVTSFGEGCARAQKPGVYSRVTEVNGWIRQVASQATWCNE